MLLVNALRMTFLVSAQDIHFSQFNMSPVNLNPALTGVFDGDYRAGANYRSQWSSVPVPYSTFSFMGDMRKSFKKIKNDNVGIGLLFNNDVSGDSRYGTTQLYIPISYMKKLGNDSSFIVSAGIQPGISNIGFRTNKLSYDSQFDGDNYNPALPTGENYPMQSRTYFDANTGLALQYQFKQRAVILGGLALSHLNSPKVSYFNNDNIRLERKIVPHISLTYPVGPKVDILSEIMYEKQGKFHETVLGMRLSYTINPREKQSINAGVYLRTKDATIARIGYNHKQWQFGMSYDINTSRFIAATNRKGAIEFSLIYIFKKAAIFTPKKRVCPIYM
jgi:type IX secretion system PorP/SprF family membrane protein